MMELWVKDSGLCCEACLLTRISAFLQDGDSVLAYYTDRFISANRAFKLPFPEKLLELRIFNEKRELWAHRSSLGEAFSWRIADDETLQKGAAKQEDPFLQRPENHYIDTTQTLDINQKTSADSKQPDEWGSRRLHTTVGGTYALPIREGDGCVKLRNYLRYDVDGVATFADYRLTGFAPQKKGV